MTFHTPLKLFLATFVISALPAVTLAQETLNPCGPYICADGTQIASCAADGTVINYFAPPCLTHGGDASELTFSDVYPDHPNAEAIAYVKAQGIVEGYSDGTYRPDQQINRAELTTIIIRALWEKTDKEYVDHCLTDPPAAKEMYNSIGFTDVDYQLWYGKYLCVARRSGIISGYPDGTFRPDQSITFVEAAKILVNGFGIATDPGHDPDNPSTPWYRAYVKDMETKNAIPTTILSFDQQITRGEMAEMIYRLKSGNNDKQSQNYEDLAGVWLTFTNTKYRYTIKYLENTDVGSNEFATEPDRSSSLVIGPVALDILDIAYWSQTPDYESKYKQYMMLSAEDYASAIQHMNVTDDNPNIENKEVGDVERVTVAGRIGYRFWVTGSFKNERGGYLVDRQKYFTYIESRGTIYEFSYVADDEKLARTMMNTFQEY